MTTPSSLGWIPSPDPRNDDFPMRAHLAPTARRTEVFYDFPFPKLDQGQTGTCEGHMSKDLLLCGPLVQGTPQSKPTAFDFYMKACDLDGIPDNDNHDLNYGTTTNGSMKALREYGYISGWVWAKTLDDILNWIDQHGPVGVGIPWFNDMFYPDSSGFVSPSGAEVGGHAFILRGYGVKDGKTYLQCVNSWGENWGLKGEFRVWATDMERLVFKMNGDAAAPTEVRKDDPTPPPAPPQPEPPAPMAPYQHTDFKGLDATTNEYVWEFRILKGTGDLR